MNAPFDSAANRDAHDRTERRADREAAAGAERAGDRNAVLRCVLAEPDSDRPASSTTVSAFERYLASSGIPSEPLQLRERNSLTACALLMHLPGRVVVLMIPEPGRGGIAFSSQGNLIRSALELPAVAQAYYVQALLEPSATGKAAVLTSTGFSRVTDMLYLERPMGGPPPSADGLPPLTWARYAADTEETFERVIAQTYADSRDCPEICGLRPVSAAIASHKAGGVFRAEHWEVGLLGGEPAGCVLVSEMPHARLAELVYMGVTPGCRGRGVGRALLRRAWEHAQQLRVRQMTLVVDERNAAARRLYERFGLREFSRRSAWLRVCGAAAR